MTTAALYIRVSTRHQAEEGFSLAEQERTLTHLAEQRGWDFRLFVDAGLSGEGVDHRPALLQLLKAAGAGELDIVAVVDESRLARDELSGAFIRHQLKQAGVILSTPSGDRDLTDPA
ncbi:MAG: recombinase family protein, partial [Acidimicrobiia bacterium]